MVIIMIRPSDKYLLNVITSVNYLSNNTCYETIQCYDQNGRLHIWQRPYSDSFQIPTSISENGMPLPYLLTGFQQGTPPSVIWDYIQDILQNPCICCNN